MHSQCCACSKGPLDWIVGDKKKNSKTPKILTTRCSHAKIQVIRRLFFYTSAFWFRFRFRLRFRYGVPYLVSGWAQVDSLFCTHVRKLSCLLSPANVDACGLT